MAKKMPKRTPMTTRPLVNNGAVMSDARFQQGGPQQMNVKPAKATRKGK